MVLFEECNFKGQSQARWPSEQCAVSSGSGNYCDLFECANYTLDPSCWGVGSGLGEAYENLT
jgi:hypothetical protein